MRMMPENHSQKLCGTLMNTVDAFKSNVKRITEIPSEKQMV